jgi:hypothetical protein
MNSADLMVRCAVRLIVNSNPAELERLAAATAAEQRDEPGNVVSIAAARTRRATREWLRQG